MPKSKNATPALSFVIIAHNNEATIARAVESVKNQSNPDFEAIVVDDKSDDSTLRVIRETVADDPRFTIVPRETNGRAHLARRTGVLLTHGDNVVFLDGDDALKPDVARDIVPQRARRGVDFFRFGRHINPVAGLEWAVPIVDNNLNRSMKRLDGDAIVQAAFMNPNDLDHSISWSIIDCVFDGDFIRAAFTAMTDQPVGRCEDMYEFFVLASRATAMEDDTTIIGLDYTYGSGVSGSQNVPRSQFEDGCIGMKSTLDATWEYVRALPDAKNTVEWTCAEHMETNMHRMVFYDWWRLTFTDRMASVPLIRDLWGQTVVQYAGLAAVLTHANELSRRAVPTAIDEELGLTPDNNDSDVDEEPLTAWDIATDTELTAYENMAWHDADGAILVPHNSETEPRIDKMRDAAMSVYNTLDAIWRHEEQAVIDSRRDAMRAERVEDVTRRVNSFPPSDEELLAVARGKAVNPALDRKEATRQLIARVRMYAQHI